VLPLTLMKAILIILMTIHGLLHLMGFLKGIRLKDFPHIKSHISGIQGVFWFFTHVIIMSAMMLYFSEKPYWWIGGIAGVALSQIMIITIWKDAKWGTLLNIIIFGGAMVAYGEQKFEENFVSLTDSFYKTIRVPGEKGISSSDIQELPYPVRNWINRSGILQKDKIVTCRIKQKGAMKLKADQKDWIKTSSEQHFRITEPGFIWKVEMKYLGILPMMGVDYWKDGKASLKTELLNLFSLVEEAGDKMDQASMQRYLAETIWFPAAAVSPYIKWTGIDSLNAKAEMNYKGIKAEGQFTFNKKGEFVKFTAQRFKDNKANAERFPWVVEATDYTTMNGVWVPIELSIKWKLPEGDFIWYKIHISQIDYNLPYRFHKPGEII
jgi:hypothetical protein